ncbi:amidase [Roseovarius faecimaris]|uniref:Amidase n=1 Tax=Roseovarius faecimaris TaxID=2494550 RepID=A0A6I6IQY1_9RHOB|nr:amidase [Roseovarius faecimaris]QGX98642.1 amidase [Roseovarius faecimaris]
MSDILSLSAVEQAAGIARGGLSAEALMQATLERIAAVNPRVNAIVSLREAEALLAEARAADAMDPSGPLHGLPIAIKDLADARGLPTSQGSPAFAGRLAEADSLHVARLRAAGAIIIGKTNTPEFGLGSHTYNPVHGTTLNPYDPSVTCGGSSGGAAVALSTGMLSIADGSDMMGSLRNPAGWCNVYGMRPSWGRVPPEPEGEMFLHQLSTNGPMARCPADLALQLDVMSGPVAGVPNPMPYEAMGEIAPRAQGCRIGWLGDWGGALPYEGGILPLCRSALEALEEQGAVVEELAPPFSRDALWEAWVTLRAWSNAVGLEPLMANQQTRGQLKPEALWEAETGQALSAMDVNQASTIRSEWYRRAAELFESYDALALPTAQVWPFPVEQTWPREVAGVAMDTYHRWMELVIPVSLIGLPAVAMPAGFGAAGLPMGIQLIGRHGGDKRLLELAEAYHRRTHWPTRRPPPIN